MNYFIQFQGFNMYILMKLPVFILIFISLIGCEEEDTKKQALLKKYPLKSVFRTNGDYFGISETIPGVEIGVKQSFVLQKSDWSFGYHGSLGKYANNLKFVDKIVISNQAVEVFINNNISKKKTPYIFRKPTKKCVDEFVKYLLDLGQGKLVQSGNTYIFKL